jgi:hypothetical protein
MMKRGVVTAAGPVIAAAALAGCSSHTSSPLAALRDAGPAYANALQISFKVDGRDQNVPSPAVCDKTFRGMQIEPPSRTDVAYLVDMTADDPPQVRTAVFNNLARLSSEPGRKYAFLYNRNAGVGNATVTKYGNSYRVTGKAPSVGNQKYLIPFEVDVICP